VSLINGQVTFKEFKMSAESQTTNLRCFPADRFASHLSEQEPNPARSDLKVCVWTRAPNHYQRAFMGALGKVCDLRTVYFASFKPFRMALGWNYPELSPLEIQCKSMEAAFKAIPDWKERIHIVPGYATSFERGLARHLTARSIPWADWCESSTPGWRWFARLPVKLWWTRLLAKGALGSFAIGSQAEDDFVRRGIPRSKISYLPYVSAPFDPLVAPDAAMVSFKAGRRAFLFSGAFSQRKGVDLLLRAAAPVLRSAPGWTLILVGNDTPDSKYKKLAQTLNLSAQIFFRGSVNPYQISSVIAAADVAVLPSRYDGWGVVVNEAVIGGLAVIASDRCGASRELIIPGFNGFRVKAGDRSDLEVALRRYTESEELARQHGEASRYVAWDVDPDLNARRMLSSLSVWIKDWKRS
jgi:glycosyltransferase involved in cell wall biosynthesis